MISFSEWLKLKEDIDPVKDVKMAIASNIDKQIGNNPRNVAKVDPKKVINQAVIQAAKDKPGASTELLNKNNKNGIMGT